MKKRYLDNTSITLPKTKAVADAVYPYALREVCHGI